jgi:hypothetical protein
MRPLALLLLLLATTAPAAEKKSVTLDVKDEDVRVILKSMQRQCGIKNLLIDRDVSGKGMVYFHDVPCDAAFRTVFGMFGLAGQVEPNIIVVEPRSR